MINPNINISIPNIIEILNDIINTKITTNVFPKKNVLSI